MAHTSAKITAEEWALGITGVVLLGGGLYLLDRRGILHIPGLPPSTATKTPPSLDIAPQNLPNVVPADHRCGTVYVSFGQSTNRPGYIIVGKYNNGKLVAQYYQPASDAPNFNAAGSWVGGVACTSSVSRTPVRTPRVTPTPSNVYGWTYVGTKTVNGRTAKCYVAQNGATLSGLQVITGVYYGTIATQNGIQNPNQIQIGQTVCVATGAAASTPRSSGGLPQLRVAPQSLPSNVTRRCGTVYYSFGRSPANAAYLMIGKYNNGKLVAQYYQPATTASNLVNKGSWSGGTVCTGSTPSVGAPNGYFYIGYKCGYPMYIPAIPRQWAWNYRIPTVYDTVANIVWIVIPGAPWTNFGKSGAQGTYLPDYDVVASYNQDGSWSGDWYVLKANVGGSGGVSLGSRPFVASRSASLNWGLNVCQ